MGATVVWYAASCQIKFRWWRRLARSLRLSDSPCAGKSWQPGSGLWLPTVCVVRGDFVPFLAMEYHAMLPDALPMGAWRRCGCRLPRREYRVGNWQPAEGREGDHPDPLTMPCLVSGAAGVRQSSTVCHGLLLFAPFGRGLGRLRRASCRVAVLRRGNLATLALWRA
jgi:hypothetical protein